MQCFVPRDEIYCMMGQINWSSFFVSGSRPDDRRTRVTSTTTTTIDVSLHLHLFQALSDLCESSSFVIRRSQHFKMTRTLNMFTFRIYDSNLPLKSFDLMLHESTATFCVAKKDFSYIIGSTFETKENCERHTKHTNIVT